MNTHTMISSHRSQDTFNRAKVCQKYIAAGDLSKASRMLQSHGLAPLSPNIIDQLRAKHPHEQPLIPPNCYNNISHKKVSNQHIELVISRISRLAAVGPDGWKPLWFKNLRRAPSWPILLNSLTLFTNQLNNGIYKPDVGKFMASAKLNAL